MSDRKTSVCSIIPLHILLKLLESDDKDVRGSALQTLLTTASVRAERSVKSYMGIAGAATGNARRTIFNCDHRRDLPSAVLARSENGPQAADAAANRVFDGFGATRAFYKDIFERDSVDDRGHRLDGFVHFGERYNNAMWDGNEMVFGDGDGLRFADFTKSLDVIGHELTHGVTQYTAGLTYHLQPGALNESISDVFGSMVKQWVRGETADTADWLIGAEIFTPGIGADALRSLKAPGTAYSNSLFGKDPQPDHMSKFVHLPDTEMGDWGGVHINSGIPNKAFFLTAAGIGGHAWEAPGHIWYESLMASHPFTEFQGFADTTFVKAGELYGTGSNEQQCVLSAWKEVGIRISGIPASGAHRERIAQTESRNALAALHRRLEDLAAQVADLRQHFPPN